MQMISSYLLHKMKYLKQDVVEKEFLCPYYNFHHDKAQT